MSTEDKKDKKRLDFTPKFYLCSNSDDCPGAPTCDHSKPHKLKESCKIECPLGLFKCQISFATARATNENKSR